MQHLLEELVRGVGYGALRLVTGGRYQGRRDAHLAEGAIGFGIIALCAYVTYAIAAR